MCIMPQIGSGARFGDELAHHKVEFHSRVKTFCLVEPLGTNPTHVCSISKLSTSILAFQVLQMIHLLNRTKINLFPSVYIL